MIPDLIKKAIFSPISLMFKIALWGIVGLIICGMIFLLFFDLNSFKERIETVATEFIQDELKINGDVKLGMDTFRPSLVFYDVKIGQDGKTTVMLSDRLEVTIPLTMPTPGSPWTVFANIQNFKVDGKSMGDYDIPIRFLNNGFEIPELEGTLNDSQLTGSMSYLDDHLKLNLNLKDMDYAEIAEGLTGGNVMMNVDLTAHGKTYNQIVRSLSGDVFLLGGKGQMAGKAIDFWAAGLLESILSGTEKETQLECTVADFNVKNGVVHARSIIFDTSRVTVAGKGEVNLVKETVDLKFKPHPKNPSLVNLATPVLVSGRFGHIRAIPEPLGMLKKIGEIMLTTVNPAMLVLPMLKDSSFNDNPCLKYMKK